MTRRASLLACPLLLLFGLSLPAWAATTGWSRFDSPGSRTYSLRYLPPSLDLSESVPFIVFLHGSGSTPEAWQPILAPLADQLGFVVLAPRARNFLGFGVGEDDVTIFETLELASQDLVRDESRTAIAGHSAGGAYAMVLAYAATSRFSGVFSLSAPYRTVVSLSDPAYTAPLRMYYGTEDPNFQGGSFTALVGQWDRLGVPLETDIQQGSGHSDWQDSTLPDGFNFLLAQRYETEWGCVPGDKRLCLQDGRFAVEGDWRNFQGETGLARAVPLGSPDTGMLWFFRDSNWEVLIKVLNGCGVNGHHWLLLAATTTVEYSIRVTDLATGQTETYTNPLGNRSQAFADTTTFAACP
ncbi:MAG: alpha/beta fold hydrolase [Acidobacteria bacterium]|nr:alpha/beta fold hydrolase [Acidobacteriota bacterium]